MFEMKLHENMLVAKFPFIATSTCLVILLKHFQNWSLTFSILCIWILISRILMDYS